VDGLSAADAKTDHVYVGQGSSARVCALAPGAPGEEGAAFEQDVDANVLLPHWTGKQGSKFYLDLMRGYDLPKDGRGRGRGPAVGVPRARTGRTSAPPLWDLVRRGTIPSRRRTGEMGSSWRGSVSGWANRRSRHRGARRCPGGRGAGSLMLPWSYAQARCAFRGGKNAAGGGAQGVQRAWPSTAGKDVLETKTEGAGGRRRRQISLRRLEGALEFYARAASARHKPLTESQALIRKGDLASETLAYLRRRRRRGPGEALRMGAGIPGGEGRRLAPRT